ncbi:hypothetical protein [Fusobacterium varium]|uniref:hypothetical protein n=1 Tax=Fusobacterium varium TaxID=856 RepID=UPI00164D3EFD|nr:hypothetical protein [Fusobacterium varium]
MERTEIRKKLLDINKTMSWLAIQLKISRRTLYRKLENDDLKFLEEIQKILSHYI